MGICDFLVITDVLCCTSSTLHLVAIAVDRYRAVTSVDYIRTRTAKPIIAMIIAVWISSTAVALPSRFFEGRYSINETVNLFNRTLYRGECNVNQEIWFTIIATGVTFFIPMILMIGIYARIYIAARGRIRKKRFNKGPAAMIMQSAVALKEQNLNLPAEKSNDLISVSKNSIKQFSKYELIKTKSSDDPEIEIPSPVSNQLRAIKGPFLKYPHTTVPMPTVYIEETSDLNTLSDISIDSLPNSIDPVSLNIQTEAEFNLEEDFHQVTWNPLTVKPKSQYLNFKLLSESPRTDSPWVFDANINKRCSKELLIDISQSISSSQESNQLKTQENIISKEKVNFANIPNGRIQPQVPKNDEESITHEMLAKKKSMSAVLDANEQKERLEAKRERKAARTLAIITGCFLSCWLPFSLGALIGPLCYNCNSDELMEIFSWLGFCNSLLNPVIYTIFSPDFRNAFRKIIFGRYMNLNKKSRL